MMWLQSLAVKIAIGALMCAAIFAGGYIGERQAGKMEQLADTVEAFRKGDKIHADVDNRDDRRICLDLGGLPEQCDELRRLAPAAESE